ncbi:VOC family protein [Gelidibacter japonicus]|jgi:predicted enzyme related to lactoylglutathione lyase|uniref:VOC family protein n=1 Tax=Gelidibacter japonicus TaxID=1962232 RepID=UPI0011D8DCE1|nr:VOC family protein [Gelidibacter japonicus]MCL8009350.1 VOC family protein [Gelidibacter japonicus]TXI80849.1 MAG: VOC family protein [Crocinitomicaceae bacterium]
MTVKNFFFLTILAGLFLSSCSNQTQTKSETTTNDTTTNLKVKNMNSYISMFEIPATDISRAVNFYQIILDIKIEKMDVEGMKMGILPYENQTVTGVIIQADGYKPSADGVTIYLNGGDNLQVILDKVEKNGGKIIAPKTAHADGSGFFAIFIDSEGNKMALNSPN